MSYGLRGYDGHVYGLGRFGLGCNPGETRDLAGGGQEVCGGDGASWSPYTAPPPTPVAPPVVYVAPPAPVYHQCDPRDPACVLGNQETGVAYQQSIGVQQADTDYERCIANGTDAGTCRARWPVGYSGEVPANTLSPTQVSYAMLTPDQASATYSAANAAQLAQLRLDLQKAGQSPAAIAQATGGSSSGGSGSGVTQSAPVLSPVLQTSTGGGFSLSSIPWWAWAGVAAVGLLAVRSS